FAALPEIATLAGQSTTESRDEALTLAGDIARTLHKYHDADDLVRAKPHAFATLHRLAADSLPGLTATDFRMRFQAALAFAGYTFWAVISLDYSDEHYRISCPHCAQHLYIVIGEYGNYSAIRHWNDGDVQRLALRPAEPPTLTGIARWMHDTAAANGEVTLADGLTYLFGDAGCAGCGSIFNIANRYEAENSPSQPIEPVAPNRYYLNHVDKVYDGQ
ncbi:MAG TPA: hypothetical protein VF062_12705, partial [Candidatus Limnocylindrales bacterium]